MKSQIKAQLTKEDRLCRTAKGIPVGTQARATRILNRHGHRQGRIAQNVTTLCNYSSMVYAEVDLYEFHCATQKHIKKCEHRSFLSAKFFRASWPLKTIGFFILSVALISTRTVLLNKSLCVFLAIL